MISNLEDLKSHIDIVDIIENYVELKKAGANFKAPCPFHDEKSASFVVSPTKQICHCFGCGHSSDAIGFVQEFKKLSFTEAVEEVAKEMNFTLTYSQGSQDYKDYTSLMEKMQDFYIKNKDIGYEYLKARGVTDESIVKFGIGYAPASQEQLDFITSQMFNTDDAVQCGVVAKDDSSKAYARVTKRITFPIYNHTNKLIGFGGRILDGDDRSAKYLNSPQTKLFDKSRNLYGYNIAKEFVYTKGVITVTEGYLDVVMFHQAGIKTAVATMGTALTKEHVQIFKKAKAKALLCFDGDRAGANAGFKASVLLAQNGIDGGIVLFPEGKDPADMVKSGNKTELIEMMRKPLPIVKYVINYISTKYNLKEPTQKQEALKETQNFLNTLSPVLQDEYKSYVSHKLQVATEHVHIRQGTAQAHYQPQTINIAELSIIKTARESEGFLTQVLDVLEPSMFESHYKEFELVLRGDSAVDSLLLRDDILVYSENELSKQLNMFLALHYTKQISAVMSYEDYEPSQKLSKIKELQSKILKLQSGVGL